MQPTSGSHRDFVAVRHGSAICREIYQLNIFGVKWVRGNSHALSEIAQLTQILTQVNEHFFSGKSRADILQSIKEALHASEAWASTLMDRSPVIQILQRLHHHFDDAAFSR